MDTFQNRTPFNPDALQCTWGMLILSKLFSIGTVLAIACFTLQVLVGAEHRDGIYILAAALLQEEHTLTKSGFTRFLSFVRLAVGAFLVPFLQLGLGKEDVEAASSRVHRKSFQESMGKYVEKRTESRLAHLGPKIAFVVAEARLGAANSSSQD